MTYEEAQDRKAQAIHAFWGDYARLTLAELRKAHDDLCHARPCSAGAAREMERRMECIERIALQKHATEL